MTTLAISKSNNFGKVTGKIAIAFGRLLVLVLTILLCVPVILLPLTTSVPTWIFILLAAADAALIILQFRFALVSTGTLRVLAGMIFVTLLAVVASQFFAATPPITDTQGQPIPGSIATLEKVSINGTEQWITIRGQ